MVNVNVANKNTNENELICFFGDKIHCTMAASCI